MNDDSTHQRRTALVAFGSDTGNASDYADELAEVLQRLRFFTDVSDLNSVPPSILSAYSLVCIVISTAGQGDLPKNARTFWKSILRKKLSPSFFENVTFTSFGLGDSSYPNYNWAVRKLYKRFLQLGATEIHHRGEGDEQHDEGVDGAFVSWSSDLRSKLLHSFPLPSGESPLSVDICRPPRWVLSLVPDATTESEAVRTQERPTATKYATNGTNESSHEPPLSKKLRQVPDAGQKIHAEVEWNRRLTPASHWQDVRHLALSSKCPASYSPGDTLTIYPKNKAEDVQTLISLMGWQHVADQQMQLMETKDVTFHGGRRQSPLKLTFSDNSTLREVISRNLDLNAVPRRSFFATIADFTSDPDQHERLIEFSKPENIDDLYDYTSRPRRSILEVFEEFHTIKIPWPLAVHTIPVLRGRQFSIASGGELKKDEKGNARFELLVAIVRYQTIIKKIREGICSRYISDLQPGSRLEVLLQSGDLGDNHLDVARPLVLVGPGTGVAPIRSLIWERALQSSRLVKEKSSEQVNGISAVGKVLLLYGCRNRNADFFFSGEWQHLADQVPLEVLAAFSRDRPSKEYVQHMIKRHGTGVYEMVQHNQALIYVCGSSGKMPTAVRKALVNVFEEHGPMGPSEAEAFLGHLEKIGRYKQETWG